jgi:hypothetical protein
LKPLLAKIRELQDELDKIKETAETVKKTEKLNKLRNTLIQEYMLYKRCGNIRYATPENTVPKSRKKGISKSLTHSKTNQQTTRKFKSI